MFHQFGKKTLPSSGSNTDRLVKFYSGYVEENSSSVLKDGPDLKLFILVGWDRSFRLLLGPPGSTDYLLLLQIFSGVV